MDERSTPASASRAHDSAGDSPVKGDGRHGALTAIRRELERLAFLGTSPGDPDDLRVRKVALTLAAEIMVVLCVIWIAMYLALGLVTSAAIPFVYQVASIATIAAFSRTKDFRVFRFCQIVLIVLLPFLLQWSLGGYVASSAVSVWALVGVFGAVFIHGPRHATPWFALFVALTVLSGLLDPWLARSPAAIPSGVQVAFFVLNIVGVSLTGFLLLEYAVRARDAALAQSDALLLNVLPRSIALRLKREPGLIAERFDDVTVLFADIAGFTSFAEQTSPETVVGVLNEIFSAFDDICDRHGLEKIKTIGDAYMAAGGLPEPRPDHAEAVAAAALEMQDALGRLRRSLGLDLRMRIGVASGPAVAGVIGRRKFTYDLWGDTVNTASRMESHGVVGEIQVNETTYLRLRGLYRFVDAGEKQLKGKDPVRTYLLLEPVPASDGIAAAGVTGGARAVAPPRDTLGGAPSR